MIFQLRLVEIGAENDRFLRRASDGTRQQIINLFVQHVIGRKADVVLVALGFQKFLDLRLGERGIASEQTFVCFAVSRDDRLQHASPIIGAVDVSFS